MLSATIEVIPEPYEALGVVSIIVSIASSWHPTDQDAALDKGHERLGEKASTLGGDGVIGIRYTPLSGTALLVTGTAIRLRYTTA